MRPPFSVPLKFDSTPCSNESCFRTGSHHHGDYGCAASYVWRCPAGVDHNEECPKYSFHRRGCGCPGSWRIGDVVEFEDGERGIITDTYPRGSVHVYIKRTIVFIGKHSVDQMKLGE